MMFPDKPVNNNISLKNLIILMFTIPKYDISNISKFISINPDRKQSQNISDLKKLLCINR